MGKDLVEGRSLDIIFTRVVGFLFFIFQWKEMKLKRAKLKKWTISDLHENSRNYGCVGFHNSNTKLNQSCTFTFTNYYSLRPDSIKTTIFCKNCFWSIIWQPLMPLLPSTRGLSNKAYPFWVCLADLWRRLLTH